jgi:uncharacterized protein YndB with AHSA1/START domain
MSEPSVIHSTFVIERSFPVPPEQVFAALADPAKKRRWFAETDGIQVREFEMDFRVGGTEHSRFKIGEGPHQGTACANDTTYQDIVPNHRVVIAYTMTLGDYRMSASLATFELLPTAKGTDLIFTEQGAYFEHSDGPQMRQDGWRSILEKLAKELAR